MILDKKWIKISKIFLTVSILSSTSSWAECSRYDMVYRCTIQCGSSQACLDQCSQNYNSECASKADELSEINNRNQIISIENNKLEWEKAQIIKNAPNYKNIQEELLKKRRASDPLTLNCAVISEYIPNSTRPNIFSNIAMKDNTSITYPHGKYENSYTFKTNIRIYEVNSIPYVFIIKYMTLLLYKRVDIDSYYPLSACASDSELLNNTWSAYSKAYTWGKIPAISNLGRSFPEDLSDADLKSVKQQFLDDPTQKIEM